MFYRDDKVVYANYGVCTVSETDARMSMGGVERTYYVLLPTRDRGGTVYVPVDHEELMRPIMNRSEAIELVEHYDDIETDDFTDSSSRTVEDHFKKLLRRCDCATAVCVFKTMKTRSPNRQAASTFPPLCTRVCSTRRNTKQQASFPPHSTSPRPTCPPTSKSTEARRGDPGFTPSVAPR